MGDIKLNSTGGGSVTLTPPSTASNLTLTLPSASGTVATTSGTGSVFTNPTINGFTGDTSVINVGSGQFYKDTSGNVGIGTSSPAGRLDVSGGASDTVAYIRTTSTTGGVNSRLNLTTGNCDFTIQNLNGGSAASSILRFYNVTAGSQIACFDYSGNLGLGVTPKSTNTSFGTFEVRGNGSLYGEDGYYGTLGLVQNGYSASGSFGWKYIANQPAARYEVGGQAGKGTHAWYNAPSGTAGNAISFTQAMTLDASGNLGIGTTTANTKLTVQAPDNGGITLVQGSAGQTAYLYWRDSDGTNSGQLSYDHGSDAMRFATNGSERARIDSSGNLLVGTTSGPTNGRFVAKHSVSNAGVAFIQSGSSAYTDSVLTASCDTSASAGFILLRLQALAGTVCQVLGNGNVQNTNNSYGAISDQSIKENIVDATPKLQDLLAVKIRNFNIKGDSIKQIGVVAQELEEVFPGMIEEGADGLKGVKYSVFVPMLVKAIQELSAQNQKLEARLAQLEAK